MAETLSPPPQFSEPDMHHGTCFTHVPWCMSGSLTCGCLKSRWQGKRSRHSQHMCNPQFYVSGKRPMKECLNPESFHRGWKTYNLNTFSWPVFLNIFQHIQSQWLLQLVPMGSTLLILCHKSSKYCCKPCEYATHTIRYIVKITENDDIYIKKD